MIGVDGLVVVAMEEEAEGFLGRVQVVGPVERVGGAVQRLVVVGGRTLLLVQSGIGLVNAAAAASSALAVVRPRLMVSAGTAGGLGTSVRVGDVVVCEETLYSNADATGFGYELGQVPGMPERYSSDPHLVTAAAAARTPDIPTRTGLVVSSDSFITAHIVDDIRTQFPQALSTDMESTALSQVAHLFGIPFVSVRGVSDLCGPTAGVDHTIRVDDASQRSATIVLGMLDRLTTT